MDMVGIQDYANMPQVLGGFGISSMNEVGELSKALQSGYDKQIGMTGGSALRVESLESSLKVLTFEAKHFAFWRKIGKTPAYSTVEEYNVLTKYGSEAGAFTTEGQLPESEDSSYQRQAGFVKFLGTTRQVTHPMSLARVAHGDVIALENRNGIMWILRALEKALFFGNSKLGVNGAEYVEFSGLDAQIDSGNVIDMKGSTLTEEAMNDASQMIVENYGIPTDIFMGFKPYKNLVNMYFPRQRVLVPTNAGGNAAGVNISNLNLVGGQVNVNTDVFLRPTEVVPSAATSAKAPDAPASVSIGTLAGSNGEWTKHGGAGTYKIQVTFANQYGESAPCGAGDIVIGSGDVTKYAPITITNASSYSVSAPTYAKIYLSKKDNTQTYFVKNITLTNVSAGGTNTYNETGNIIPNTDTVFIGELTPEVITFKQFAPLLKMDLATIAPAYRWMILLYGTMILFAPKKWAKIINVG